MYQVNLAQLFTHIYKLLKLIFNGYDDEPEPHRSRIKLMHCLNTGSTGICMGFVCGSEI
jgi:hypothetical protein